MIPTLSQVCSLHSPLAEDLADYAAGQCQSVEIWFTKLENFLESHSPDDFRQLLEEHQIRALVASYQGGLLTSQGEARREAWQLFERRLDVCQQVGIRTVVVACDIPGPLQQSDVERAQTSLEQLARTVGPRKMRAALEFQARAAFGNNLQTAAAMVGEVASPHLGLCFDSFQFYVGPSKLHDLGYLNRENLFHVQLADLADRPREFATDSDRILPGEGDIPFDPILDRLRQIGYEGPVSIELMNPQIWEVPPLQFGEIALTALRRLLGLAEK